ncbi:MAG: family 10 glycosylhydrolase [Ignavibacteria bacterium]|jgi:uncharacterized lipoprotein YddW (UPF0748 family)
MKNFKVIMGIVLITFILVSLDLFAQSVSGKEERAVWLHGKMFSKESDEALSQIKEKLDEFERIGINTLFYYCKTKHNEYQWDNLVPIIKEAHKRKMEVHVNYMPGHKFELEGEIKEHPEWLRRGIKGEIYPQLNIALPEVREYMVRKISEVLEYDIDGIHLDYIRFQVNQGFSYDEATCDAFKKIYGVSPLKVHMDTGSMVWCEWLKWNTEQVTRLVRGVRKMIDESGKDLVLGVDVFADNAAAKSLIAQDWKTWADEGLIDIACPMDYTNDVKLFEQYVKEQVKVADGKCKLYAGIAVSSSHNKNTPEGVKEEVKAARKVGADGVAFFSGYSLKDEFIDELETFYKENK